MRRATAGRENCRMGTRAGAVVVMLHGQPATRASWWPGRRRLVELSTYLDPADVRPARAELDAQLARPEWRSFVVEQRAMVHQLPLLEGALSAVDCPIRIVAGTEDPAIPRRTVEAIAERV